jgi:hypothetical protein
MEAVARVNMRELYSRALSVNVSGVLGNYNRGPGKKSYDEIFPTREIEYFRRHGVEYDAVKRRKSGDGLLISIVMDSDVRQAFEQYASECAASVSSPVLYGRVASHLARLTSPFRKIEPEKIFGIEMLRHMREIESDYLAPARGSGNNRVSAKNGWNAIEGEGSGTVLFWTFAPYLYRALTVSHGYNPEYAVMSVISWPFRIDPLRVDASRIGFGDAPNYLPGLEMLHPYCLGSDPDCPTHEFTGIMAEEVAVRLKQTAPQ